MKYWGRPPAITRDQYDQLLSVVSHDTVTRRISGDTIASLAREWGINYETLRSAARQGIKRYDYELRMPPERREALRTPVRRGVVEYWRAHLCNAVDVARAQV